MIKQRRKLDICLNCRLPLKLEDNFCPQCGQENHDQNVSLFVFLNDFITNYLSFDSSLYRTIPAFLLKPGKITKAFNEGKRRRYLHPIRLYLILSLFYFFAISAVVPPNLFDQLMSAGLWDMTIEDNDRVKMKLDEIPEKDRQELDSMLNIVGSYSLGSLGGKNAQDTLGTVKLKWRDIKMMAQDTDISDSSFYRAMETTDFNFNLPYLGITQQRKFIGNSNLYVSNSARNLPIMMFVLLPFFALLLKILYIRHKKFYVEHLIHSLVLHAFAYLIYGLGISIMAFHFADFGYTIFICFLVVTTYAYISLLNLHGQGWFKTLVKFNILGLVYLNLLIIGVLMELYISLLVF
ncbi:DUF3667 domain-containing protein [Litoribacter ruber]|uniref:DUF3667 domain-containing protein n=1 Tax=Litoribacter ruber TaxID=702568 RepID=A0AAP2CEA8_9BACT|nr:MULTISPECIES: DUF3667 domain-containing protein [Litoribacter]MBS9522693.1 DUF3667 domain-containing protein [Litoribacter alkaliphilus]MBT0811223.1 DUF3667 domain-containing protein [Litoribacter ruber]